jgi:hypothetical protein
MAQYTYATRLSEHIAETEEGYLLCTSCVLCRSGVQQYKKSELDPSTGDDTLVDVFRPPAEVTAKKFLGSIAAKGVTRDHPGGGFLSALTHAWSAKGTVLNARVGPEDEDGNVTVIGDIVITDPNTIEQVKGGLRQLSLGYKYQLVEGDQGLEMRNLICNHAAIVESGRAGNAQIVDARPAAPVETFEQACARRLGRNALDVEREGTPAPAVRTRQAQDDGDDLAPWLAKIWGGEDEEVQQDEDNMAKTKDEERAARIDRLCDALEALVKRRMRSSADEREAAEDFSIAEPGDNREKPDTFTDLIPVETLPESERGHNPVVDTLRALKPFIQASGERRAIDAFNTAMRAAKAGRTLAAERLIAAYDWQPPLKPESFESIVARRRAELLGGKSASEPTVTGRHAEDRQPEPESYQTMVDRRGRELRSGKK